MFIKGGPAEEGYNVYALKHIHFVQEIISLNALNTLFFLSNHRRPEDHRQITRNSPRNVRGTHRIVHVKEFK